MDLAKRRRVGRQASEIEVLSARGLEVDLAGFVVDENGGASDEFGDGLSGGSDAPVGANRGVEVGGADLVDAALSSVDQFAEGEFVEDFHAVGEGGHGAFRTDVGVVFLVAVDDTVVVVVDGVGVDGIGAGVEVEGDEVAVFVGDLDVVEGDEVPFGIENGRGDEDAGHGAVSGHGLFVVLVDQRVAVVVVAVGAAEVEEDAGFVVGMEALCARKHIRQRVDVDLGHDVAIGVDEQFALVVSVVGIVQVLLAPTPNRRSRAR